MELLTHVKPTQSDIDRAAEGDPLAHPLLRHILGAHAEFLTALYGEDNPPFFPALVRRCFLTSVPLTPETVNLAMAAKLATIT